MLNLQMKLMKHSRNVIAPFMRLMKQISLYCDSKWAYIHLFMVMNCKGKIKKKKIKMKNNKKNKQFYKSLGLYF